MIKIDSIGVILLAAGASIRLGGPKQLLKIQGETLLRRQIKIALAVTEKIVVTLGANYENIIREISDLPVQTIENKDWKNGMSSSIKVGLNKLIKDSKIEAAILMVCDQPFVDENLLIKLIEKFHETDSLIVASRYENTLGVPAIFRRELFPELLALNEKSGAKSLIKKYAAQTAFVDFPKGAFDIDTPEDYKKVQNEI